MFYHPAWQHILWNRNPLTVADPGEGPGGPAPPLLFWVKKEEVTEGKKASRTRKSRPPLSSRSGFATEGYLKCSENDQSTGTEGYASCTWSFLIVCWKTPKWLLPQMMAVFLSLVDITGPSMRGRAQGIKLCSANDCWILPYYLVTYDREIRDLVLLYNCILDLLT